MLLDEEPATLIQGCIQNFNIAPDRSSLTRISTSLSALSATRQVRLQSLQSDLSHLSRHLSKLSSQHQLTVSSHNPSEYSAEILRLDAEKFRVAKQANDLEIESERLELELENLKSQLNDLDAQGIEGGAEAMRPRDETEDETVLKLKVYRSLGIDAEPDTATGQYNKAVIRNTAKGDVHVVNIDTKFSRYFYANYFWQTL
ncbi:Spc24-domain-containing protein [Eremomyces bilateralis CBS 781.70]|uniref:Kinetochore protein Spc24 n=1 Tax=Eremomyces bilateralis CBS 781.70 TaxID=1392243 RepID=A0A6G1G1D4_9PEZI|nr:Spc24-domain-containing protein [Eremomyces bilateralis CBS 781.70]KAF1811853.1 Spc24-domain-containing protein [Eremomyces bilateralis CBS 781.70]